MGLPGAVFIVFLVLKLVGTIDWSWWWVTCPLWAGVAIAVAIFGAGASLAALGGMLGGGRKRVLHRSRR